MSRNEQTSKRVASMAGKLLRAQNQLEALLRRHGKLVVAVAASALTQARNKPRRK